ncbi:MAG: glycosyltransferase [Gemmataceae bacterium]
MLSAKGYDVHLYAETIASNWEPLVEEIDAYEYRARSNPNDLVIYQHADSWPTGERLLNLTCHEKIIRDHEYFFPSLARRSSTHPTFYRHPPPCAIWSSHTAGMMSNQVFSGVETCYIPPLISCEVGESSAPSADVLRWFDEDHTNILTVASFACDLCPPYELVETFAHYHRYYNQKSRLFIIIVQHSSSDTLRELERLIQAADLQDVISVHEGVTRAQLRTFYLIAHAFLGIQHHGGIHIPLIHAMYHHIPIIACDTAAVAETLGMEALTWDDWHPVLLAESLHYCLTEPGLADALADRQFQYYQDHYSQRALRPLLFQALASLFNKVMQ